MSAPLIDAQSPFPGLASYREEDVAYFQGRAQEIDELLRLVRRETLVVLHGLSGFGKSSLIRAGVFPRAAEAGLLPIPVRLEFGAADPLEQLKTAIPRVCAERGVTVRAFERGETLWSYFHRVQFARTPLLVLDQFEEIFTLGRTHARRDALITELTDLIENYIPSSVRDQPDAELPDSFDQPTLKVLVSLREDYLPDLEDLRARIPSLSRARMRLRPLKGPQAFEAVSTSGRAVIAEDVARAVVRFVAGAKADAALEELQVEPALLSLVCRELNERRRARGLELIGLELLEGEAATVLNDFYDRSLSGFPPEVRAFIEDRLLTTDGFRTTAAWADAVSQPGLDDDTLNRLVASRLLRREERLGLPHVEIVHDVIAGVARVRRERRTASARQSRRRMRTAVAVSAGVLVLVVSTVLLGVQSDRRARARDLAFKLLDATQRLSGDDPLSSAELYAATYDLLEEGRVPDPLARLTVARVERAAGSVRATYELPPGSQLLGVRGGGAVIFVGSAEKGTIQLGSRGADGGLIWHAERPLRNLNGGPDGGVPAREQRRPTSDAISLSDDVVRLENWDDEAACFRIATDGGELTVKSINPCAEREADDGGRPSPDERFIAAIESPFVIRSRSGEFLAWHDDVVSPVGWAVNDGTTWFYFRRAEDLWAWSEATGSVAVSRAAQVATLDPDSDALYVQTIGESRVRELAPPAPPRQLSRWSSIRQHTALPPVPGIRESISTSPVFSEDGRTLVATSPLKRSVVVATRDDTGQWSSKTYTLRGTAASRADVTNDGRWVAVVELRKALVLIDQRSGVMHTVEALKLPDGRTLSGGELAGNTTRFSRDGAFVYVAGITGWLCRVERDSIVQASPRATCRRVSEGYIDTLDLTDSEIVTGDSNGAARLHDAALAEERPRLAVDFPAQVAFVAFASDDRVFLSSSAELRRFGKFDAPEWVQRGSFSIAASPLDDSIEDRQLLDAVVTEDGATIVVTQSGNLSRVRFDVAGNATAEPLWRGSSGCPTLATDGTRLATCDGAIIEGTQVRTLRCDDAIGATGLSKDGKWAARMCGRTPQAVSIFELSSIVGEGPLTESSAVREARLTPQGLCMTRDSLRRIGSECAVDAGMKSSARGTPTAIAFDPQTGALVVASSSGAVTVEREDGGVELGRGCERPRTLIVQGASFITGNDLCTTVRAAGSELQFPVELLNATWLPDGGAVLLTENVDRGVELREGNSREHLVSATGEVSATGPGRLAFGASWTPSIWFDRVGAGLATVECDGGCPRGLDQLVFDGDRVLSHYRSGVLLEQGAREVVGVARVAAANGTRVLVMSDGGVTITTPSGTRTIESQRTEPSLSADGKRLLLRRDQSVELIDTTTGEQLLETNLRAKPERLVMSPDGARFATLANHTVTEFSLVPRVSITLAQRLETAAIPTFPDAQWDELPRATEFENEDIRYVMLPALVTRALAPGCQGYAVAFFRNAQAPELFRVSVRTFIDAHCKAWSALVGTLPAVTVGGRKTVIAQNARWEFHASSGKVAFGSETHAGEVFDWSLNGSPRSWLETDQDMWHFSKAEAPARLEAPRTTFELGAGLATRTIKGTDALLVSPQLTVIADRSAGTVSISAPGSTTTIKGQVTRFAASADARSFAWADTEQHLHVWRNGAAHELEWTRDARVIAFSSDGLRLAVASDDAVAIFADAATPELSILTYDAKHVVLAGDLAITAAGRTIHLWDLTRRTEGARREPRIIDRLDGHEADVTSLWLSPDRRTLISGDAWGRVLSWDLSPEQRPAADVTRILVPR